jgi:type I restriction enzyme S subunit
LAALRPFRGVETRFVLYQMRATEQQLASVATGSTFSAVSSQQLKEHRIVLAPSYEQPRIVAEIEKQFTRLDAATAALKRVQANLKRYRASVLKAACEGRLVPTEAELARKEGRDYEPADKLLQRILRERRACWEADTLAKMQASGKPPKDNHWKQKYKEPSAPDITNLPPLPEGWCWTRIGYAFDCIVPNRDKPESFTGEIPWLTLPDFTGEIEIVRSLSGLGLSPQEASLYRARIVPARSVVMSCVGRFGITAVLQEPSVINQQLHAFIMPNWIPARFYAYMLRTQTKYMEAKSTATTIAYLNKDNCNSVPMPIPPLSEQERIVAELDRQMAFIDALGRQVDRGLQRAAALRRSVLTAAFTGQLVPQDPTDEPASVLLERIHAERAANVSCKSARKR